jgi:hypothetical protein
MSVVRKIFYVSKTIGNKYTYLIMYRFQPIDIVQTNSLEAIRKQI